jgi:hypothetical protein
MRAVLPALTEFEFGGRIEYLNDLVAEIDAPRLRYVYLKPNQLDFLLIPQLLLFIGRTENLRFRRVRVDFTRGRVGIDLRVYPYRLPVDDTDRQPFFHLSAPFPSRGTHVAHIALALTQFYHVLRRGSSPHCCRC